VFLLEPSVELTFTPLFLFRPHFSRLRFLSADSVLFQVLYAYTKPEYKKKGGSTRRKGDGEFGLVSLFLHGGGGGERRQGGASRRATLTHTHTRSLSAVCSCVSASKRVWPLRVGSLGRGRLCYYSNRLPFSFFHLVQWITCCPPPLPFPLILTLPSPLFDTQPQRSRSSTEVCTRYDRPMCRSGFCSPTAGHWRCLRRRHYHSLGFSF